MFNLLFISSDKLSTFKLNSNVPSLIETKLNVFISTWASDDTFLLDLSFNSLFTIASLVNKVSSVGRPTIS